MLKWVRGTGDGYGDGYGNGYGYGYDNGDGYGYGNGYGFGNGNGYGYGDGGGYGFGYGYGYGDGYGDGYGYGYGDGYGMVIGGIEEYEVRHLSPWPYVRVGCKVHHVDTWRDKWMEIAVDDDIDITQEEVDALLKKAVCHA